MNTAQQFYQLSEILNDDLYLVAFVIRSFHKQEIAITVILKHLEAVKLENYVETIDLITAQPQSVILECSKGLTFATESCYIRYLQGLLDLSNIPYSQFKKGIAENSHLQRGLF